MLTTIVRLIVRWQNGVNGVVGAGLKEAVILILGLFHIQW